MHQKIKGLVVISIFIACSFSWAQTTEDSSLITLDRMFSGEFRQDYERSIQWDEDGEGYIIIEKSNTLEGADELVYYSSKKQERRVFISAEKLQLKEGSLAIESFTLSPDGNKVLFFTNSSRVWRSNTKGDYWVYDLQSESLTQIGTSFEPSSLMFAKFSTDGQFVFYVQKFNIYKEHFLTHKVIALTKDGTGDIINGTFDWVYEEEFGKKRRLQCKF